MSSFRPTRRQVLGGLAVASVGLLGVAGDGVMHGARDLNTTHVEVKLPRLPAAFDGFTIAQLSDFHYDDTFTRPVIEAAVALSNNLKPDLVVLTGDYVTQRMGYEIDPDAARDAVPCAELLARLNSRLGTFAILGNHDYFTDPKFVTVALEAHHITVLRNRSVPIEGSGTRFWLAGVDDVLGHADDVRVTLRNVPDNEATVLLVHEPDVADNLPQARVDLQLSGHSHGGQIVLPLIGAPYLPDLAHKYWSGLYKVGPMTVYTNRGVGTIRVPVRLNAPPEVTIFTLRPVV